MRITLRDAPIKNFSEMKREQEIAYGLGKAVIEPNGAVIAGSMVSWKLTITVGAYGIDEGGTIMVSNRFASDTETPQFDDPKTSAYTSIETSAQAVLVPSFQSKAAVRPFMKCLVLDVKDGSLSPGDTVVIRYGDTRQGSPGIRCQTFQESRHVFRVMIDPTNACLSREIADSPIIKVVAGETHRLTAVAPSECWPGRQARLRITGFDSWGNPTGPVKAEKTQWVGEGHADVSADGSITMREPGVGRFVVESGALQAESNPVRLLEAEPRMKHYWGDLHAQSDSTVGTGSEHEYFHFAREQAHLDVAGHQANDFQLLDDDYDRLNQVICEHHKDGVFVILHGYEWSANTPAGGDRNVFFASENQPIFRSSNWQIENETRFEIAHPASELFEKLKRNGQAIVGSHVGGRYADIGNYYDEEVCRLIEVVSCWGVFEWMIQDAVEKDYTFGIMCNSDGHKGRPGAEGPGAGQFGINGGLTCMLAPTLSRAAIFEALKERQCYGTSGPRILMDFQAGQGGMGDVLSDVGDEIEVRLEAHACAPIEKIELFGGKRVLQTYRPPEFDELASSRTYRILWRGARHRGRGRRLNWNGAIHAEDNEMIKLTPIAFDSPADYARLESPHLATIRSSTTGDCDGVEIALKSSEGRLRFESEQGKFVVNIGELGAREFSVPGLDAGIIFEQYPESVQTRAVACRWTLPLTGEYRAIYCRLTQTDGHVAWTSPIFLREK